MDSAAAAPAKRAQTPPIELRPLLVQWWPAFLGFAALVLPALKSLELAWTRESGAHGPLVLVTGLWLLARQLGKARADARQGALWLTTLGFLASLAIYGFGVVFDFVSLSALGLFGVGVALLHEAFGLRVLLRTWFPFFYLAFVIPPPGWLIDSATAPLKQFVSELAVNATYLAGLPISRQGVTIFVSKYKLLMEDACSGMNSLIGLVAISLLYIYLLRGSSARYAALMTCFAIPIAIVGNIMRVIILILLTFYFGDEVAQGFLHYTAGFLLFALDLGLVFFLDSVLIRIVPRSWRGTA